MKRKEIITHQYVDEYGEVKQTTEVTQYVVKQQHINNGPFITVWQQALKHLAFCDLSPREVRLLLYLMAVCGQENQVVISNPEMADFFGYKDTSNISRTFKKLERRGYIIIDRAAWVPRAADELKVCHVNYAQLNVNIAYKGKISDFKELAAKQSLPITDGSGRIVLDNNKRQSCITPNNEFDKQGRLFE